MDLVVSEEDWILGAALVRFLRADGRREGAKLVNSTSSVGTDGPADSVQAYRRMARSVGGVCDRRNARLVAVQAGS